mmetsp:Transcript_136069/g.248062  ORF Transcript_136069/g.248062 Transcript_136069/m.248062 type:complete len:110 (+) Transcript_136069:1-330(+)
MDVPLMDAISAAAMASISDVASDPDEAARGAYALAWAQGRLSRADLARSLVAGHVAHGSCHRLSLGLVILDEEWGRLARHDGALAALESITGQSVMPSHSAGKDLSAGA